METLSIKVIIGSTRQGRFSEIPARWITEILKKQEGVQVELLDLRDYPMPFFDELETPSSKKVPYANPAVAKWTEKILEADGFVVVSPEYNHGPSAVLKNALDYVYQEWNKKPVGFISYGSVLGARAIEQLRLVAVELQMTPIRNAIHIPREVFMAARSGDSNALSQIDPRAIEFIGQLLWWAKALKVARKAT